MTTQIATTKEQSQRLIACGVNPDSADMFYTNYHLKPNDKMPIVKTAPLGIRKDLIPAWSLSALLVLLPKEITDDNGDICYLSLAKEMANSDDYNVAYKPCLSEDEDLVAKQSPSPIEACVKAVEWLTTNGYKLNKP